VPGLPIVVWKGTGRDREIVSERVTCYISVPDSVNGKSSGSVLYVSSTEVGGVAREVPEALNLVTTIIVAPFRVGLKCPVVVGNPLPRVMPET